MTFLNHKILGDAQLSQFLARLIVDLVAANRRHEYAKGFLLFLL